MKSIVELYWSTNACTLVLIASVSAPGEPTTTETVPVPVVPRSVSETPGITSLTTLEVRSV